MIELKGKPVADSIYSEITNQLAKWSEKKWAQPHLAVILVGEDPASEVYVSKKQSKCEDLGFKSTLIKLSTSTTEAQLTETILKLNNDPTVDGILLQLPLPPQLNPKKMTELIHPSKDADGLTQMSLGALVAGVQKVTSCTPAGIMEMLRYYKIEVAKKNVVVVGRSLIVGTPLFHLLNQANATVTLCHSKTENIKAITANADIVFVAIGKLGVFNVKDFKKGAVVVDVGMHRLADGLRGDVSPEGASDWLSAMTPVPGGVGPLTIAMLMKNTMTLAQAHRQV